MKKKTFIFVCVLLIVDCFNGCFGDRSWNVDQNRLQVEKLDTRWQPKQKIIQNKYKSFPSKHSDSDEIEYSHYTPQIVKAPNYNLKTSEANNGFGPKVYQPMEDPSEFYKNRIFKNMTLHEKRQRQGKQRSYNPNTIHNNYKPKVTSSGNGLSIRINGATVHVRPQDQPIQRNQRIQAFDVPFADAASRNNEVGDTTCIRCPAERTVITSKGVTKIILLEPVLQTCDGSPVPQSVQFKILYGPRIGDLLGEGSHISVGIITVNNQTQQHCQYRYNVVVKRCPQLHLPRGINSKCPKGMVWGAVCTLSCVRKEHVLKGKDMVFCNDKLEWSSIPTGCEASVQEKNWCSIKHISRLGKITCDTPKFDISIPPHGVSEGSVCSVLCNSNQKMEAPKIITCKSGKWQGRPVCKKSKRRRHKPTRRHLQ